ncbi:hypothetical protein COV53_04565 [Candidatus Gottesmanbacteria bacterium CG11_big_fil_rev_8_21_14_0_20_37_11]|uniref:Spore protein YkvP/CgeB glycosyl transferase-like domain-containing protein n=1 Tax=Candidatus Gottesmanbacteria bacterium CG11_big_fil_rev_8_21_14_0_20_37_11 TaxID=1974575 RepID=A0A2H0NGZ4_9BACT|nr:MAG: hypothetical protein COV53_04565 [Candidatus Gottesmanbacteria bacterium CG11_big_fil_rev_8_21_14_0_20_37_11]
MGIKSEYFKIGFETRINNIIRPSKRIYDVTFIGSFSLYHHDRIQLLEEIANQIPIDIWGSGVNFLSKNSVLRKRYHGEAWGIDMYDVLSKSKIVVNKHLDIAGDWANNMRLFETTGMGTMLMTDNKMNLNELFEIDKEIIAYENSSDLIKKIKYYLHHDGEREKIAQNGQMRTCKEHSYKRRMKELIQIVKKYL